MLMTRQRGFITCLAITLLCIATFASAADWARFRGPNGSGVSQDKAPVPTNFSDTENLKWKVALPGPGSSSPIIVGDRTFEQLSSAANAGERVLDLMRQHRRKASDRPRRTAMRHLPVDLVGHRAFLEHDDHRAGNLGDRR